MTITYPQMQSTTSSNNLCEKYKLDIRKQLPVPAGDKRICPVMLLNHESEFAPPEQMHRKEEKKSSDNKGNSFCLHQCEVCHYKPH